MTSKSKIRLRESRAIGGELGVRIVEGDNGLCLMFKAKRLHILHFLTKPGEPIVIEMSFPYADRTEFIEKLWSWSYLDSNTVFEYKNSSGNRIIFNQADIAIIHSEHSRPHVMGHDVISGFRLKLRKELMSIVQDVDLNVVDEEALGSPGDLLQWVEIPDFNGDYYINRAGEILSVKYKKPRIRRPIVTALGYHFIQLTKENENFSFAVHRLIYSTFVGELSESDIVDHIDGNPSNNSLSNLRKCTFSGNAQNSRGQKGATSKHKGVHRVKSDGKWEAKIMANRKLIYLGRFTKEEDAALAYNEAAKELHGEYARLNDV